MTLSTGHPPKINLDTVSTQGNHKEAVHLGRVVADLLDVRGYLLHDLLVTLLRVLRLGGVHLVAGHDHLLDTQGVRQQGVLTGLAVLRDTGLKTTCMIRMPTRIMACPQKENEHATHQLWLLNPECLKIPAMDQTPRN